YSIRSGRPFQLANDTDVASCGRRFPSGRSPPVGRSATISPTRAHTSVMCRSSLLNPTYRGIDTMKRISVLVFGLILLVWAAPSAIAADVEPPEGFHALFNGEDLAGWHGMPHFDPQKLEAMSEEERQKQLGQWWKE